MLVRVGFVFVAKSRAIAEDALDRIKVDVTPQPFVLDSEEALNETSPVHPEHGSNILLNKNFTWGPVDEDFSISANEISFSVTWAVIQLYR